VCILVIKCYLAFRREQLPPRLPKQAAELERGADLLVGTPGRINMFVERGKARPLSFFPHVLQ
jgi:hypothetical protein